MTQLKRLIILCLLLISSHELFSQPMTIAELVDIALENNPSTRQAWWNAQRAAAGLGSAKSSYYPQITFDASVNHGRDFKFINGPDTNYTIVGADILLNLLLYDFGERCANVEAAKNALTAAGWQNQVAIQKVLIEVLDNTYAALHADETVRYSTISLKEAEKVLQAAKELNRTGLMPVSDVYTAQANFSQMKMALAQHKAQLDVRKGRLAATLGLSPDTPLELAQVDALPEPPKEALSCLIDLALKQRSELMAMQARSAEAFARQKAANAANYPTISFFGRGGANHAVDDHTNAGQYLLAVNLEMPIFTGFDLTYKNRMAYANTQMTLEEQAKLELDIALEVLTSSRTLQATTEMLPYAEDNLQNAQKAYESVLAKYQAGKERITDVSYALEELAQARISYSDVKTRWYLAIANLAYSTGSLIPYMESPCKK